MAYLASCRNCVRFAAGACTFGLTPEPGDLYCKRYEITPEFRDEIARAVMRDMQVDLSETARKAAVLLRGRRLWN